MSEGGVRTFLTLGPAGLSLEWSDEDALEPDHLANSPATQAADESTGAWIIHHPSRGGPTSGLREVTMALATHGCVLGPSIGSIGCGFLAGNPHPHRKRPGQWGWRARMLRARRLDRAAQRRERERVRRESGRRS